MTSLESREALKSREEQLALEVKAIGHLQDISTELITETEPAPLYEKILDAAVSIMRSDFASLQMLEPGPDGRHDLLLLGHRGFSSDAARFWRIVRPASQSTCGMALRLHERVLVSDVDTCDWMAGSDDLATYRETGIRAVQTTPLLSRTGQLVGMISTHWHNPHQPSDLDLHMIDLLARQAADLIERTRSLAALRESEERYRTLTLLAPVGIFLTDEDGDCISANEKWQTLTGLGQEEALGKGWLRALHPEDRERVAAEWRSALATGSDFSSEYRFPRPDNTVVWVQGKAAGLTNAAGERTGFICTVEDVTGLKKAQLAREEFIGLMSHELRTPITTVYGMARLLETRGDRLDDSSRGEVVRSIREDAERLNRMIENLLILARLEGSRPSQDEPVLVPKVIDEVLKNFLTSGTGRVIRAEIESGLPLVTGHADLIEHVLRNLLGNAEKYSEAGTPIDIRACHDDNTVVVSVLDRGIGIAEGEEDVIFDQFYRSPRSAASAGGAGLGLTVCKRLVEAQNGRIWAKKREGGGLEIAFSLPVLQMPSPLAL